MLPKWDIIDFQVNIIIRDFAYDVHLGIKLDDFQITSCFRYQLQLTIKGGLCSQ